MNPAALNAALNGDMENALIASTPGGIGDTMLILLWIFGCWFGLSLLAAVVWCIFMHSVRRREMELRLEDEILFGDLNNGKRTTRTSNGADSRQLQRQSHIDPADASNRNK